MEREKPIDFLFADLLAALEFDWSIVAKDEVQWLKPKDYASFEKLTEAVKKILKEIGNEYKIKFKDESIYKIILFDYLPNYKSA